MNVFFSVENSASLQARVSKDQADLRQIDAPPPEDYEQRNMATVFRPLEGEEFMGSRVKAYTTGVNRQWIDPKAEARKERSLRNTYPELMDAFDSKPKLFVRNFRALKPSDKVKCLGQYRDPRPCVAVDKELEPMPGHEYD